MIFLAVAGPIPLTFTSSAMVAELTLTFVATGFIVFDFEEGVEGFPGVDVCAGVGVLLEEGIPVVEGIVIGEASVGDGLMDGPPIGAPEGLVEGAVRSGVLGAVGVI
jgi:hypothetical protein